MPTPTPILPEKYYLDNFKYILNFLKNKCAFLLNEAEKTLLNDFEALPENAQCLFVRLLTRKYRFVKINSLQYNEIDDLEKAVETLLANDFIVHLNDKHRDDALDVLPILTKAELLALAKAEQKTAIKKLSKDDLVLYFATNLTNLDAITAQHQIIKKEKETEIEMLFFLFYGTLRLSPQEVLSNFVIRDLGHLQFHDFEEDKLTSYFKTRQEAEQKMYVSKLFDELHQQTLMYPIQEIIDWFEPHLRKKNTLLPRPTQILDRCILFLGKFLEKQQQNELALSIYQHSQVPPSRERQVRILHKLNAVEESLILCKKIEENPQNADEKFFALDFRQKIENNQRQRTITQTLKKSDTIAVSIDFRGRVEQGALDYFAKQGYEGFFAENNLWNALFTIAFWETLFDEDQDALHHPFQLMPSDLRGADFYEKRKTNIDQALKNFTPKNFNKRLDTLFSNPKKTSETQENTSFEQLKQFVAHVPFKLLRQVLLAMVKNPSENRRGFPDLFLWKGKEYFFAEIKSPTDNLSAQQLFWLHFFEQIGIVAKIVRVVWE